MKLSPHALAVKLALELMFKERKACAHQAMLYPPKDDWMRPGYAARMIARVAQLDEGAFYLAVSLEEHEKHVYPKAYPKDAPKVRR